MINFKPQLALATGLALALAACGGEVEEADDTLDAEQDVAITAEEYDPMTRDYTLSAEAQERRGAFDSAAFSSEYAGYRDEILAEADDEGVIEADNATVEVKTEGGTTATTVNGEPVQPMGKRTPGTNMRARKDMSWGYLDRNKDGQLSVAEYAIWAIPLDPNQDVANDAGPVQLTDDQINKAADSFFYYDVDGDTYLDQREFTAARRGEDFG